MALFAVMAGNRVSELLPEDPGFHFGIPIYNVSNVAGIKQNWVRNEDGTFAPPPAPPMGPEDVAFYLKIVDNAAESARQRFLTSGSGQAMVYQQKQVEATAAANDTAPTATKYPILAASVGVEANPTTGAPCVNIAEVAQLVLATAAQWSQIAARIESLRLSAKAAIAMATAAAAAQDIIASIQWPVPA